MQLYKCNIICSSLFTFDKEYNAILQKYEKTHKYIA